jgi:hypothetical protein
VIGDSSEADGTVGKNAVRISKPVFIGLIVLLVALTGFSSVMAIKHRRGIYNTFFKSSQPPRDTLSHFVKPAQVDSAKPDNKVNQPVNNDNASSIPPEVDSIADSILRGVRHKPKSDPQFYRDSVKAADTTKLSF